jgi:hypothetical protein
VCAGGQEEEENQLYYHYPTEAEVQAEFTAEFFWFDPYKGVDDLRLPQEHYIH